MIDSTAIKAFSKTAVSRNPKNKNEKPHNELVISIRTRESAHNTEFYVFTFSDSVSRRRLGFKNSIRTNALHNDRRATSGKNAKYALQRKNASQKVNLYVPGALSSETVPRVNVKVIHTLRARFTLFLLPCLKLCLLSRKQIPESRRLNIF